MTLIPTANCVAEQSQSDHGQMGVRILASSAATFVVGSTGRFGWFLRIYSGSWRYALSFQRSKVGRSGEVLFLYGRSFFRLLPFVLVARRKNMRVALDVVEGLERFQGRGGWLNPVFWDWWLGTHLLPRLVDRAYAISTGLADRCRDQGVRDVQFLPALENWPAEVPSAPSVWSTFRLLYVGSLVAKENPAMLLELVRALAPLRDELRLDIAGRYMDTRQGREWARRISCDPAARGLVMFHGAPSDARLGKLKAEASGFLLLCANTVAERLAFPTRLVEFLKLGRPVWISDVGDARRYLRDGEEVFLLSPNDSGAAAERLRQTLANPTLLARVGLAGFHAGRDAFDRAGHLRSLQAWELTQMNSKIAERENRSKAAVSHPAPATVTILFVVNSLSAGGAEKQVLLSARMLAEAGYCCVVLAMRHGSGSSRIEALMAEARSSGVIVLQPSNGWFSFLHPLKETIKHVYAADRLVIWSWGHRAEIARLCAQALRPSARSLVSLRSAYKEEIDRLALFWGMIELFRPTYLSNSQLNLDLLARHYPAIRGRAFVVYNALEHSALREMPVQLPASLHAFEILMLGNVLVNIKGYDLVVHLARELKLRGVPARIRIGGAPIESEKLRQLIIEADVQDMVLLDGVVQRPYDFLRSGNAFLLMSRIEGMPNALLEAMCLGLPCISTKVGEVASFTTDRENIRLVNIGDYQHVADILEEWQRDWALAKTLGTAARQLCHSEFAPEIISKRLREIMAQLYPSETEAHGSS